jgi:biopolymer transport protein ExbD
MRRRHTLDTSEGPGINMTPLIDMVFIILIFFIVTSSFVKETGVQVQRPNAKTAIRQEQGNILIAVTEDGRVWLDGKPVDIRSLRRAVARLHAENPEASAVILADAGSRTGVVVQAMDQARLAGVQNVALGAARPK